VATLEGRVNARLFRRDGSRMVPTEAGQLLVIKVRQSLRLLERNFARPQLTQHTQLTLSLLPSFASRWFAARLAEFVADYPQIDLMLHASLTHADLARGEADCAVRFGPGGWPELQQEFLMADERFPVCSPRYNGGVLPQRPEDLAQHSLLRNPWMPWEPWFDAASLSLAEPARGPSFNDASIMLDVAESGLGIALARRSLVESALREGRLIRLFEASVPDPHSYYFVWRADNPKLDAILALREWLKEQCVVA
jgi:DNA-binding transcriptional LysR family regulator